MLKRIIAFVLLLCFMCFKCLTWVPTAAMSGIPAIDAFYYAVMQTLGMAVTNGADIDLSTAIAEVRTSIPDYLQQPDVSLKYLLRKYASVAWDKIMWDLETGEFMQDVASTEVAAIGLSNASGVSIPTLADIVGEYQKKAINLDYEVHTPIDTNTVAFFNKFSPLYINEYLEKMDNSEYITYPENSSRDTICSVTSSNIPSGMSFTASAYYENGFSAKLDRYATITYNGLKYPFMLHVLTESGWDYFYVVGYQLNPQDYNNPNTYWLPISDINSASIVTNYPIFYDVNQAVEYSRSGRYGTSGDFSVSVPNAVIDTSTDDGKIVANPIYWVVDNDTGNPIDAQINLDQLAGFLKSIIDGTNTDTSVDFGDLVDAGVIEDADGNTITGEQVISVPITDVIDDALARDDPLSIPVAIDGVLPPLPPLPPFFPTPDFPEGDPTSGFTGMSVLARIINVTNQSLPSELVITFYGVVFGAVVLGLIKILHK